MRALVLPFPGNMICLCQTDLKKDSHVEGLSYCQVQCLQCRHPEGLHHMPYRVLVIYIAPIKYAERSTL
jgi:hypothetical protein